jgi:hypothetical protein
MERSGSERTKERHREAESWRERQAYKPMSQEYSRVDKREENRDHRRPQGQAHSKDHRRERSRNTRPREYGSLARYAMKGNGHMGETNDGRGAWRDDR